jgi:hypothetical protein
MHRIDSDGATVDNQFTEGNPATGTPATQVSDDWLNDVQENICEVIEDAGLTLAKGDHSQLKTATRRLTDDETDTVYAPAVENGIFMLVEQ